MSAENKQESVSQDTPFAPPPETVTINEVAFMHQILQACAQRGAFKPEEFKDIGSLNDKLKALLDYAKKLEEAAQKKMAGEHASSEKGDESTGSES